MWDGVGVPRALFLYYLLILSILLFLFGLVFSLLSKGERRPLNLAQPHGRSQRLDW